MKQIILASVSPRRKELLSLICKDFKTIASDVDESKLKANSSKELTMLLAKEKCLAVLKNNSNSIVIGCDTVVELNGQTLEKPKDKEHARQMITSMSGISHYVHTSVYITDGNLSKSFTATTQVTFDQISLQEVESYISTDDPYDKAGGYGIQSGAAKFVKSINGCYYNVMGFPVSRVYKELLNFCNL